jgi:hypothetical protein
LQSIKIHFREFLYGFMCEAQQTPRNTCQKSGFSVKFKEAVPKTAVLEQLQRL